MNAMKESGRSAGWQWAARGLKGLCILAMLPEYVLGLIICHQAGLAESSPEMDVFVGMMAFLPALCCLWAICARRAEGIRWGLADVLCGLVLLSGLALAICGMEGLPLSEMPTIFLVGPYVLCMLALMLVCLLPPLLLLVAGLILIWRKRNAS